MPAGTTQRATNLEQLLDKLGHAPDDGDKITIGGIVETVGRRSFGPLLLVTGLLAASPLAAVPGIPTTLGLLTAIIAVQMLLRRDRFWLPKWITNRHLPHDKFCKGLAVMRKPARVIDRFLKPRLEIVTRQAGLYTVALICSLIGVAMPSLEIVPFSAHIAGLALTAFGLALIAHDGLLGLIALAITAGAVTFVAVTTLF